MINIDRFGFAFAKYIVLLYACVLMRQRIMKVKREKKNKSATGR